MRKRLVSLFITITMICAFIPVIANAEMSINIGEYVQMGTYYGQPILWRCVDIDENGPLMLSDKILCIKAYDAGGSDTSGSHGREPGRESYGSNYWADSNIRSWLNSTASAGNVEWLCGNPPVADELYNVYNAYDDEAGFLSNFTESERNAMKPVSQKSLVSRPEYENGIYTTGTERHEYTSAIKNVVKNYDTAYAEYVTDKMFLMDVKQVNSVYNNGDILGEDYHIGEPTAQCVENSEYKDNDLREGEKWYYWLRSPYSVNYNYVRYVNSGGSVHSNSAYGHGIGVRPAFYLNLSSSIKSGSGALSDPYTIVGGSGGTVKPVITPAPVTSVSGSSGDYKLVSEAGLDPENLLENITFGTDSIKGPKMSVLGYDFYLFEIDGKLKLNIGDVSIQFNVDAEKQTIQLMGGYDAISESVSTGTDYTDRGAWTKSYNQLKSLYTALSGGGLDDKTARKQFGSVYNNMKAMNSNLFLNIKGNFAIYGEMAFDNGSWKLSEGGAIIKASASGSIDPRIGGVFYGTLGISLSASGKIFLKYDGADKPLAINSKLTFEPALNIGIGMGSKAAKLYIEGGLKGKMPIDIMAVTGSFADMSSNITPFTVKLQGYIYVSGKAFIFGDDKEWQLGDDIILYPRDGELSISSIDEDIYSIEMSDLKMIPRDYGAQMSIASISDEFDKYDLYPYSAPKLEELSDGRRVLLWVDDDASKADADRTSLYYSMFDPIENTWSNPAIAVSNASYNEVPQVYSSGDKLHIVWSAAEKTFGNDADINEMSAAMGLYYTSFDGSSFGDVEPVSNVDNGVCEMLYDISEKNGTVTIAWAENTENDISLSTGTNYIYKRTFDDGVWSEKETVAALTGVLNDIKLTDSGVVVYDTSENGISKIYAGNELIGESENYSSSLQTVGNRVYYISDSRLVTYDIDTGIGDTAELGEITDITVLENGDEKTALSLVSTGFTNELYQNEFKNGKWGEWTKLTSYDRYIRDYSVTMDEDGALSAALNLVEVEDDEKGGYGTAELKVISDMEYYDVVLDSAYYDGSVIENSPLDIYLDVTNNSRETIDNVYARIVNGSGEEIFAGDISCSLAPGETKTLSASVTIPQGFRKQEFNVDISCAQEDDDMSNNSASFTVGLSDLSLEDISIYKGEDGIYIDGIVRNIGFETAENITLDLRNSDKSGEQLDVINLGAVSPGESAEFKYKLPEKYTAYSGEKQSIYIEAATDSQELNIGDNSDRILFSDLSEIAEITDFTASYNDGVLTIKTPISMGVEFYAVYYDSNGNLMQCIKNTLSVGAGTNDIELTGFETGSNVKFLFWDENMNPLCDALTWE